MESMMRNPPWTRDEHILTLDFYLQHTPKIPGKTSQEVIALSERLNRLQQEETNNRTETFRNPSGVYMKLMNFRRFDPNYSGTGLANGSKDEEVVWNLYASHPMELHSIAEEIRRLVSVDTQRANLPELGDDEVEAEEGKMLTRLHRYRERDRTLVAKKKSRFLRENGSLHCEACGFNFEQVFGDRGKGFIECHHVRPVSELSQGGITRLSDLVLLCSNCHRMVHKQRPWIGLQELQELIRNNANTCLNLACNDLE
jgi:5-methylcytosine-specific restriction enzyme A